MFPLNAFCLKQYGDACDDLFRDYKHKEEATADILIKNACQD